jgi:hypothetical protein
MTKAIAGVASKSEIVSGVFGCMYFYNSFRLRRFILSPFKSSIFGFGMKNGLISHLTLAQFLEDLPRDSPFVLQ